MRTFRVVLLAVLVSSLVVLVAACSDPLHVYFLDVGQGDAIALQAEDGTVALIDGGNEDGRALTALQDLGITRVDLVIATHPHSDHIGGLIQVLRSLPVGSVVTNGVPHTTSTYEAFLDAIAHAEVEYREVSQGDVIPFGGGEFQVLNPASPSSLDDLNEASLVLRYVHEGVALLFTGDIGSATEARLIAAGLPLDADILKVAHHGSCYSTSAGFLKAVSPLETIVSVGENDYGHPCQATLDRIRVSNARIWTTQASGTITVEVSQDGYSLATGRSPATPTGCHCLAAPNVRIDYVFYDGAVLRTEADEYVQISNNGTVPVCMDGWRLVDIADGKPTFLFPSYTLGPSASLRVYTNEVHPETGGFSFAYSTAVWNNSDPDTAALFDCAGTEVSRKSY